MHLILGRKQNELVGPRLHARITCWFRGGHLLYWNKEFGDLWCADCGGVWRLGSDPFSRSLSGRSIDFDQASS